MRLKRYSLSSFSYFYCCFFPAFEMMILGGKAFDWSRSTIVMSGCYVVGYPGFPPTWELMVSREGLATALERGLGSCMGGNGMARQRH